MKKNRKPTDNKHADTIRTFICIEIPDSIKSRIGNLQESLRQIEAQISWTKPSNIHLTLKFLGSVKTSRIESVTGALERAGNGIHQFELEIGGAGCFPSPRNPRVLWVGVPGIPGSLKQFYENIERELEKEGFQREKRKFSPHLTIGRVRTPRNAATVAAELIATGFESETFTATEVIVMRSDLKPTGSIYTPQFTLRLN